MSNISTYHYPTTVHFGLGSSKLIESHLRKENVTKILLVSDHGVASLPFFSDLSREFSQNFKVDSYHDFSPNPCSNEIDLETKKYSAQNQT